MIHQRLRASRAPVILLAALLPGIAAFGEGVVRDSIGPISGGRGGTNLAHSDNLSLINDNPAGLVREKGFRVELSLDLLLTDINYRDPQNDADAKSTLQPLPTAALSWRIAEAPRPIAVGLGLFLPAGFGAEYEMEHPAYGRQTYRTQAALFKLLPAVSIDLGAGFSIGGAIGPAFEMAEIESPLTFQTGALAGTPVLVDTDLDGVGYAWNLGIQWKATERLTFGIAYIAKTAMDLEGRFSVDGTGVIPFPDATATYDAELRNTWPMSLGVGGTYRWDAATVSLDFFWFDWSSAFDGLTFKLSDGDNPFFDGAVGPKVSDTFPLDWKDNIALRVGGEYFLSDEDTLRRGYIFMTNPVPDSTLTPLIPAILQHSVTVGYGRRFGDLRADVAYQFSWGPRRYVETSDVVGGDFDESSVLSMAHWFILGVSVSL